MKFPSKVTSYNNSIVSKFPIILNEIKIRDYSLIALYNKLRDKISIRDFIDVLDCLYVLDEIKLNKEVIHYANRNTI